MGCGKKGKGKPRPKGKRISSAEAFTMLDDRLARLHWEDLCERLRRPSAWRWLTR